MRNLELRPYTLHTALLPVSRYNKELVSFLFALILVTNIELSLELA